MGNADGGVPSGRITKMFFDELPVRGGYYEWAILDGISFTHDRYLIQLAKNTISVGLKPSRLQEGLEKITTMNYEQKKNNDLQNELNIL